MNPNSVDILVPISLILGVVLTLSFSQYLSYRNRKRTLRVLEHALKRDAMPDYQTLEAIAWVKPRRFADFRRGGLFLAIAIGVFAFSFSLGQGSAQSVLQGLTALPAILGVTYLLFHYFTPQDAHTL